jgi:hypothetical protein
VSLAQQRVVYDTMHRLGSLLGLGGQGATTFANHCHNIHVQWCTPHRIPLAHDADPSMHPPNRLAAAFYAAGDDENARRHAAMAAELADRAGADAAPYVHLVNVAVIGSAHDGAIGRNAMLAKALHGARDAGDSHAVSYIEELLR